MIGTWYWHSHLAFLFWQLIHIGIRILIGTSYNHSSNLQHVDGPFEIDIFLSIESTNAICATLSTVLEPIMSITAKERAHRAYIQAIPCHRVHKCGTTNST